MKTADQVRWQDLDFLITQGRDVFTQMSGRQVMITGGAGFLGYYLVQAALHWNRRNADASPIRRTALDNFVRAVPVCLTALLGSAHGRLLKHDITIR